MKLNGYRASHRNKWFLITTGVLTPQEFLLFEYYLDLMAFDKNKGNKFAVFEVFPNEVAQVFDKHEDTVENWHNGLLSKGFIQLVDKNRKLYTVKTPLRYIIGLAQWGGEASRYAKEEKDQAQEIILENIRFSHPKSEHVLQDSNETALKPVNTTENSLSSSKGNSIVSSSIGSNKVVLIKQKVRSDEEYQKIYTEGSFDVLTPDDMKWIDQNVQEKIEILNDEHEKEIVRIYFDGKWDEYRGSLIN
ncbi:MAG: hypothetical protein ABH819_03815 [Patescibacteria group bacterium]